MRRSRYVITTMATSAVSSVGSSTMMRLAVAVRSKSAARKAMRPKAPMAPTATRGFVTPMAPATAATMARVTTTPPISTGLSLVPNWLTAKSLRNGGAKSMARLPTELIGVGTPVKILASSVPSARPMAAARKPDSAPAQRGAVPVV